jgi:hypothetical protein
MGQLTDAKLEKFKEKVMKNTVEYLSNEVSNPEHLVSKVLFVEKFKEAMCLYVLDDIKYNGSDIVSKWISKKWNDDVFDWDDESDKGIADYYEAHIQALKDGHFIGSFDEAFTKVTGLSKK